MDMNLALLVVDIQNDFCHEAGAFAKQGMNVTNVQRMVPTLQGLIMQVRKYSVPVIYTRQVESEEVTPPNLQRLFQRERLISVCAPNSWGSQFYQLQPLNSEHIFEKYTYDAFSNPQLEKTLDGHNVDSLIITGVNLDVCIDTTIRRAFTEGYNLIIPRDCIATATGASKEVQDHYLKIFKRFYGDICDSYTITEHLTSL